jgi:hypothetical protein
MWLQDGSGERAGAGSTLMRLDAYLQDRELSDEGRKVFCHQMLSDQTGVEVSSDTTVSGALYTYLYTSSLITENLAALATSVLRTRG